MELLLMRHAESESGASFAEDSLRPLTANGKHIQERVAHSLKQLSCMPDHILCSPRLRAVQTAQITAEGLGFTGLVEEISILDGGYAVDALVELLSNYDAGESVLCVGHEPDMSEWAATLLSSLDERVAHFGTSSIVSLVFDAHPQTGQGSLRYFYCKEDLV